MVPVMTFTCLLFNVYGLRPIIRLRSGVLSLVLCPRATTGLVLRVITFSKALSRLLSNCLPRALSGVGYMSVARSVSSFFCVWVTSSVLGHPIAFVR